MESWSAARVEILAQVPSCAVHLVGEKNSKARRGPASGWWDSGIRYCMSMYVHTSRGEGHGTPRRRSLGVSSPQLILANGRSPISERV